ncbi:MAG: Signal transduction histidine kinase CheA [uncultured Paraburkholderia sp.]|nr:MAG: Signal transduction histidine kinase CheA [uncultured Paraburkholderia sp.]CAH2917883.1 MAG: Signal transduction histidine kinase CheA [uncultured Paraburkholderia sp.]
MLRKDMIDTFLETKDVLSGQLADYSASAEPDAAVAKAICAKLEQLHAESRMGATAAAQAVAEAVASGSAPEHVVEQAVQAKITLRGVGEKDQELLAEELGNLGNIVGQVKSGGDLTLWLQTDVTSDDIIAVCCFVIDESQISIGCGTAPADDAQQGEPGTPDAALSTPAQAVQAAQPVQAAPTASPAQTAGTAASAKPTHGLLDAPAAPAAAAPQAAAVSAPAASSAPAANAASAPAAAPAETDRKAAARPVAAAGGAEGSSIRVGVEKVDQLINLVGELVITQAMLAETTSTFDPALHDRLFSGMAQLERNARDLQEAVMSIRMMPMDYVFSCFPRLVRDLAAKLGKEVELVTFGQATELDKSLIERIIGPLTHLVRNSLDHGIETVEARRARIRPTSWLCRRHIMATTSSSR